MKKLSAACIILGISLFVGGCSNDHADDHIISLQDKISDAADSVSAQQETQNSSQDDRVYMDELSGSLRILTAATLPFPVTEKLIHLMFHKHGLNVNMALYSVIM